MQNETPPAAEGIDYFRQSAEFYPGDNTGLFALPPDVDLAGFPVSSDNNGFCDDEMMRWLRRHRTASLSNLVRIRNAGTTGVNLHLSDLRVEALTDRPAEPVIWFSCPSAGSDDIVEVTIDLADGGRVEFGPSDTDEALPGSAFSFSLAPGEGGVLIVDLIGGDDEYRGMLAATLQYGSEQQSVTLRLDEDSDTFRFPGTGSATSVTIMPPRSPDYPFFCTDESDDEYGCTLPEIRQRVG
ncbi:hypothetical protein [Mangrovihabitans endophyticus]|uniref:hypothetical protein n=1 Tax=Mangrovihabitans endophyticus TaxID=1751298 RepID=UPI001665F20C|nr:hypothetical protein [Mangrovihabitans endophyticus]